MKLKATGLMAILTIFMLSGTAFAESYKAPLDREEIKLMYYRHGSFNRVEERIFLKCMDLEATSIKTCKKLQTRFEIYDRRKKEIRESKVLGNFPARELSYFLQELLDSYDSRFDAGPLIIATGAGTVVGFALGGEAGAVIGGILGVPVDLIKLPFFLPWTAYTKIRRTVQKGALSRRFKKLVQNRKYRITKVSSRLNFKNVLNKTIEFSKRTIY